MYLPKNFRTVATSEKIITRLQYLDKGGLRIEGTFQS